MSDCYYYLGYIYKSNEEVNKSIDCFQKALEIRSVIYGENNLATGDCLFAVGEMYKEYIDLEQAKSLISKALIIRESFLSNDSLEIAECLVLLGKIASETKTYSLASAHFIKALDIYKSRNYETLDEANAHTKLGIAYHNLGLIKKAGKNYRAALNMYTRLLGDDNVYVADSYLNIARVNNYKKKYPQNTKEMLMKAIKIRRKINGEYHEETADLIEELGMLYSWSADEELSTKTLKYADIVRKEARKIKSEDNLLDEV